MKAMVPLSRKIYKDNVLNFAYNFEGFPISWSPQKSQM